MGVITFHLWLRKWAETLPILANALAKAKFCDAEWLGGTLRCTRNFAPNGWLQAMIAIWVVRR
ncbi:hypothetical protein X740_08020 [Mesorhizobium sp. LNHC221B00]|nr:hypothetical protein X740_08020 [Mesorhizobium sp. LNHC221B00]